MPFMSYELALELREAGFPQNMDRPALYYTDPDTAVVIYPELMAAGPNSVRVPTLSELIKACGSEISIIVRSGSSWSADGDLGDSVVEAVARRWIGLHGRSFPLKQRATDCDSSKAYA
jgi:hypothetical protein